MFDPEIEKWTYVDSTNDAKIYFSMKQLADGSVLAIGGSSSLETYDLANDEWSKETNLIGYPVTPYLFEINNKVIVLGNSDFFSLDLLNFTQQFPIQINTLEYDSHYIYLENSKMLKIGGSTFINDLIAPSTNCYVSENIKLVNIESETINELPDRYSLAQNYPNPFNPSTTISFSLPTKEFVTLKIYDVLGKEIATLVNEELPGGKYSKHWNAEGLSSGIYFYNLTAGNNSNVKKMLLIK